MIAGALLQALDDAPLAPAGHHLVNLRFAVADIRREADGRTYHALVRFRAVTDRNAAGADDTREDTSWPPRKARTCSSRSTTARAT